MVIKLNYIPIKLKEVKAEIRKVHESKGSMPSVSESELRKQLKYICGLTASDADRYGSLLPMSSLIILADYIVTDFLKVDTENIVHILKMRMNNDLFNVIFIKWTDKFKECSIGCRRLIRYSLDNKEKCGINFISEHDLDNQLEKWIDSGEILMEVCMSMCKIKDTKKMKTLHEAAEYYGIAGSVLEKLSADLYYCCCNSEEYIINGDSRIYSLVNEYTAYPRNRFIHNFMRVLNVEEMLSFPKVWQFIYNFVGEPNSKKCEGYFNDCEDRCNLTAKYSQWYYIRQIYDIFGDGERARYWKGRIYDYGLEPNGIYCRFYSQSNVLILTFMNYVVIEFKKEGPLYIFTKGYFDKNISRLCQSNYSNMNLRQALYHRHTGKEGFKNRIEHRGDWRNQVDIILNGLIG